MHISRYLAKSVPIARFPRIALVVSLVFIVGLAGGCDSPNREWAKRKDLSALCHGRTRAEVLDQFGQPQSTTTSKKGTLIDTLQFVQDPKPGELDGPSLKMHTIHNAAMSHDSLAGKTLTVQVNYDRSEEIENTYLMSTAKAAQH